MPIDPAALGPSLRAFVAIRLGPEVEDAIGKFIDRARESAPEVRWAGRKNLHMTLCFLGAAAEADRIAELDRALGDIAASSAPFDIAAGGAQAFPNPRRPRVIWIGIHGAGLAELAERVIEAAQQNGLAIERRPFRPHLTIGRVRGAIKDREWPRAILESGSATSFGVSRVERVVLYRSVPGREGSAYYELESYALGG